jgi:YVTN family beta-propeller protein
VRASARALFAASLLTLFVPECLPRWAARALARQQGSNAQAQQQSKPVPTLLVLNKAENSLALVDPATMQVVARVPTGEGPHEVAISRDGRWALVSNYGPRGKPGNSITVIDVGRAAVARTITVAGFQRPHGMAFLPGDTLAAVTAETARALLVVDVRAVREVEAHDVHPRVGQRAHGLVRRRHGPDRRDDLRPPAFGAHVRERSGRRIKAP